MEGHRNLHSCSPHCSSTDRPGTGRLLLTRIRPTPSLLEGTNRAERSCSRPYLCFGPACPTTFGADLVPTTARLFLSRNQWRIDHMYALCLPTLPLPRSGRLRVIDVKHREGGNITKAGGAAPGPLISSRTDRRPPATPCISLPLAGRTSELMSFRDPVILSPVRTNGAWTAHRIRCGSLHGTYPGTAQRCSAGHSSTSLFVAQF